jgi:ribonucleotide reductase alpha subunit
MKELYKTSWEIKQRVIIDMSADRGRYICQTQSLNIFIEEPDFQKLSSMHFYGHSKGLKTGSYYLRTKPKAKTQQFTIDPEFAKKRFRCAEDNGDSCVLCSS